MKQVVADTDMSSKRLQISLVIVGALAGTIAVAAHQALPTLGANGLLAPRPEAVADC